MNTPLTPQDFTLQLQFAVPGKEVFNALTSPEGITRWWTIFCDVNPRVGNVSSYHFPKAGFHAVMRTLTLESPRLIEWECIDSKHADSNGYSNPHDWIGTKIRFSIQDLDEGKSRLDFTHFRLNELECFEACSNGWSFFLNESLRGYLEQGQGEPWNQA